MYICKKSCREKQIGKEIAKNIRTFADEVVTSSKYGNKKVQNITISIFNA